VNCPVCNSERVDKHWSDFADKPQAGYLCLDCGAEFEVVFSVSVDSVFVVDNNDTDTIDNPFGALKMEAARNAIRSRV